MILSFLFYNLLKIILQEIFKNIGDKFMSDYVFKMKKGDIEIELKSDDAKFIQEQLDKWRETLLKQA